MNQINPDQFNHGWGSKNIPTIDNLYKDSKLEIKNTEEERKREKEEEERVKQIIDNTVQKLANMEDDEEESSEPIEVDATEVEEREATDTGIYDEEDPYAKVKEVLEIVVDDSEESEDEPSDYDDDLMSDY